MGVGLLTGVLGIYTYSMLHVAVKQENFLDEDFDKPGVAAESDARTSGNSS